MTPEQLGEMDSGTGLDRLLAARGAGAHSVMALPLIARGAIMGMVVLYRLAGSRPFTSADLALAGDLVARAAVSVDNARHYTRERATALELQAGLLPRQIPEVPGLELACRYVPAQTAAEVGGDWFDVIPLPRGRAALTVGDVIGHDVHAAAVMGQLRTATHAFATLDLTPSQTLTRLDQLAADLTDEETSATCIYGVHDPATARLGHRPGRAPPAGPGPPRPRPRFPRPAPRPAPGYRRRRRRALPGHPPACTSPQHPGPVHRRAHRESRCRYEHRNGAPGPNFHERQPAARHRGLRHPAGRAGPQPGRRRRCPHGPNVIPG